MSVMLRKQRDGRLRPFWYGEYVAAGTRKIINLGITWAGSPPASFSLREPGDRDFELSRKKAEEVLAAFVEESSHKGRSEHLTERLIESKTGRAVEYSRIEELPQLWRAMGRGAAPCSRYLAACDAHFRRFTEFMHTRNPEIVHLYEVTPEDAAAFVAVIQAALSQKTVRDAVKLLNKSFACRLPIGAANPFASFMGHRQNGDSETVHRKPFTPEELQAMLNIAHDDPFIYPLIVMAACTGMRRGDVCGLKWADVDLAEGMLAVKTSKTGADVEIPIFNPLRAVLEERQGKGSKLVFPEAARMLADNPDGLTWRFKKIVARAFAGAAPTNALPTPIPATEIESAGITAIMEGIPEGARRDRILDTFKRYCAGASVRDIVKEAGHCKATVSNDLHAAQDIIGKPFLRVQTASVKAAVRKATQSEREHGQRAASVRDWHALRATFVTLALSAGVPVELVRRVTGHATVEIVLKHYFRPDREQFRAALTGAMPDVLTGGKRAKLKPADELAALAGKVAAGTATDGDMTRLKKLAKAI